MKIRVIKIGRPALPAYGALVDEYAARTARFASFENIIIKMAGDTPKDMEKLKERLAKLTAGTAGKKNLLIYLSEHGELWDSETLAGKIRTWQSHSQTSAVDFLIGGPYGLPEDVIKAAAASWSLSPAVFPSDLAWLIVNEQIYRAYAIINGSKYHHA